MTANGEIPSVSGNTCASTLGNRTGAEELEGDKLHNELAEKRVTKRVTVKVEY